MKMRAVWFWGLLGMGLAGPAAAGLDGTPDLRVLDPELSVSSVVAGRRFGYSATIFNPSSTDSALRTPMVRPREIIGTASSLRAPSRPS